MYIDQLLPLVALPAIVFATTIDIIVGGSSLVFDPDNVTATQGDLLNFHFASAPASVAQSTFEKPCVPSKNGIWSGQVVVAGPTAMVYQINVTDTNPIWLYCAVGQYCSSGMAMVVNPPSSGDAVNAYKAAAASATPVTPTSTSGGRFIDASEASDTPSSAVSSSSSISFPMTSPTSAVGGRPYVNLPMGLAVGAVGALARRDLT